MNWQGLSPNSNEKLILVAALITIASHQLRMERPSRGIDLNDGSHRDSGRVRSNKAYRKKMPICLRFIGRQHRWGTDM
jgi:hypothetical protein